MTPTAIGPDGRPMLTDQSGGPLGALSGPNEDGALPVSSLGAEAESALDVDQVDGRVKASSLKKIGDIIEKHPEEAVSIIRSWIYQDQA
jgi:flagellar M-ring protein FliF